MNRIFSLTLPTLLAAVTCAAAVAHAVVITPDYLVPLAEEMRTNNPALRSAEALTQAAEAEVAAVRTWEDPNLVMGGVAGNEGMRADEGDLLYGVEQKLPLFGKPRLEREAARAALLTENASRDYQFQKKRVDLARAAFRTALAERVVLLGQQDLDWLDTLRQLQENNAPAGLTPLADVLRIQNERSRRLNQLETDRALLAQEKISLNRLLNRSAQAPWPSLELPPVAGAVPYSARLEDLALKFEPKTLMQRQQAKQAEARVAVARRQSYPDVSAGVEVRNYSGDGSFRQEMLRLNMSLPWFNQGQIRADVRREEARLSSAQWELASEQAALREDLHQLTLQVDAARRDALLYRDQIIPRTEATLDNLRSGWQAGQTPFREVLDTHRALLEAQLTLDRSIANQYQGLSELALCCGLGDLSALPMIGAEPESTPDKTPTANP